MTSRWWGRFPLEASGRGLWTIGPMRLAITRSEREWRIERWSDEGYAGTGECRVEIPSDAPLGGEGPSVSRFSFAATTSPLEIAPQLADRSVVVYPESPFFVTANQQIRLYCSTPMWVRVRVGEDDTELEEFPILRPPDTWFGKSTRQGELCYATRTAARLNREDLALRRHRAVTELVIANEASDTLQIERVNLSVPLLALHASADGAFWTDRVRLHRTEHGRPDELKVIKGPPEWVTSPELVSSARVLEKDSAVSRVFEALFQ